MRKVRLHTFAEQARNENDRNLPVSSTLRDFRQPRSNKRIVASRSTILDFRVHVKTTPARGIRRWSDLRRPLNSFHIFSGGSLFDFRCGGSDRECFGQFCLAADAFQPMHENADGAALMRNKLSRPSHPFTRSRLTEFSSCKPELREKRT
jgi:hypothetical protein